MKNILGLDLGTNSIGWAVIGSEPQKDGNDRPTCIQDAGSRIIPMDASLLGNFEKGNSISQTSERTKFRMARRINERRILRRERLLRVLNILNFLPAHYSKYIDRYGRFTDEEDHKIEWQKNSEGKHEFMFMGSFNEMLEDFRKAHPDLLAGEMKIPYDWTIYYLRSKALHKPVTKQELAWILLNFNQKRGYFQVRGAGSKDEKQTTDESKMVEYVQATVISVEDSGDKSGKAVWWNCRLDNGMTYKRKSEIKPDYEGKVKEFIVTTDLDGNGKPKVNKYGEVQRHFKLPTEDDWSLIKIKTDAQIADSGEMLGEYIYHALLKDPMSKIRGKLIRTVDRKLYKDELHAILKKQTEFIPELHDKNLYARCIEDLYHSNIAYRNSISNRDFEYLIADDILLYQRPLKSKKSLIDNCPYEYHIYVDEKTGVETKAPVKCAAKSQPIYQEFRLWQFVQNLRIINNDTDKDETDTFIRSDEDRANIFKYLYDRVSIDEETLLKDCFGIRKPKGGNLPYRWNYVEAKEYPCNETRGEILNRLNKAKIDASFLDRKSEEELWLILYSAENSSELEKALSKYSVKHDLGHDFVDVFKNFPAFDKNYGSYSVKAISKLLPIMRMGQYWNADDIPANVRERITDILQGKFEQTFTQKVIKALSNYKCLEDFHGVPLYLACYIVYGRHSEVSDLQKWESPEDIDIYLNNFKQYSLRNPIVEQVVTEALRTTRDIWKKYRKIDEIHIELGRDLKSTKDKRKDYQDRALENETTNMRIKALLMEFVNPDFKIEDVRPFSPMQQDLLRIYEEGALNSSDTIPDFVADVLSNLGKNNAAKIPSHNDILRYKLWLDQKYKSPYTGQPIPLSRLFTTDYQIEHIIPRARYFDDSFNNKVICEAEVNARKGAMLGHEFIVKHGGESIQISGGRNVKILTIDAYEDFVKNNYAGRRMNIKRQNLMMDDIPEKFIHRQLNDSRYISRLMLGLMSNIVRDDDEKESTSKHVIATNGAITDRLKKDWGINDVWNRIILPRFRRMNNLEKTKAYTATTATGHEIPSLPFELQFGFSKKRIDHRHHAMDAIVIACASRNIVNYLNNSSACADSKVKRYDLQNEVCDKHYDNAGNYEWIIKTPWDNFQTDVYNTLNNIVVSFKNNLRIINKTTNYYQKFVDGKKKFVRQEKGDSWAVRKSMHKDTVFREVNVKLTHQEPLKSVLSHPNDIVNIELKEKINEFLNEGSSYEKINKYFKEEKDAWSDVNVKKIDTYYYSKDDIDPSTGQPKRRFFSTRKMLDESFDQKKIRNNVLDSSIRNILLKHLENCNGDPKVAFSPDGIDAMNENIIRLNGGKKHMPIYKVPYCEEGIKFSVGQTGAKSKKYVESDKGTLLFFVIYEDTKIDKKTGEEQKVRKFSEVSLQTAIEREKQGLSPAPDDENGNPPIMVLSPLDLVYVPTRDELINHKVNKPLNRDRIYKMVSYGQGKCYFVKNNVAEVIKDKVEFESHNKSMRTVDGEVIKDICLPLTVSRLGEISLAYDKI